MATKYFAQIAGLLFGMNASASVLYHYEGPDFVEINDGSTVGAYTTSMHLEFQLQFAAPLPVNRSVDFFRHSSSLEFWSVSDGRNYWDSNVGGPFEGDPPRMPRFEEGILETDGGGNITAWTILFALINYPDQPPTTAHLIYSVFPPTVPESPATLHDVALMHDTNSLAIDWDDEAYTDQSGSWKATQVVPLPSAGWLFLSGLPMVASLSCRKHR